MTTGRVQFATSREEIEAHTELISLYARPAFYDMIKLCVDNFVKQRHPEFDVDAVNPMPFPDRRVEGDTYRIKVRVPRDDVNVAYEMGRMLYVPEALAFVPKGELPPKGAAPAGKGLTEDERVALFKVA
jgi:hypothetical protein